MMKMNTNTEKSCKVPVAAGFPTHQTKERTEEGEERGRGREEKAREKEAREIGLGTEAEGAVETLVESSVNSSPDLLRVLAAPRVKAERQRSEAKPNSPDAPDYRKLSDGEEVYGTPSGEGVFARSSRIMRTPPDRQRCSSTPAAKRIRSESGESTEEFLLRRVAELEAQVTELKAQNRALITQHGHAKPEVREAGVQTVSPAELKNLEDARKIWARQAEALGSEEVMERVASTYWPACAYRYTRQERKSLSKCTGNRIMLIDPADEAAKRLVSELTRQFPALQSYVDAHKESGWALIRSVDAVIESSSAGLLQEERTMGVVVAQRTESILQAAALVAHIRDKMSGPVTIAVEGVMPSALLRKMAEFLEMEGTAVCSQSKSRPVVPKSTPAVITVSGAGKTFSEVLRTIKENVRPEDAPEIVSLKKKDECVRMVVKPQQLTTTLQKLRDKVKDVQIEAAEPRKKMVVKGLDAGTTADELKEALCKDLKCNAADVLVNGLRNLSEGRQLATVSVPVRLVSGQQRRLRIGFNMCSLEDMRELERCFRCWEKGHLAKGCRGPDRSRLCFRCLEPGHRSSECESSEYTCAKCTTRGHRTGECSRRRTPEEGGRVQL